MLVLFGACLFSIIDGGLVGLSSRNLLASFWPVYCDTVPMCMVSIIACDFECCVYWHLIETFTGVQGWVGVARFLPVCRVCVYVCAYMWVIRA